MTYHDDPNLTCTHEELVQVMQVTVVVPHGTKTINKRVMRDPATRIGSSVEDHTRCAKCGLVTLDVSNTYISVIARYIEMRGNPDRKLYRIKSTLELFNCGLREAMKIVETMYHNSGDGEPKESTAHITIGQIKKEWNL